MVWPVGMRGLVDNHQSQKHRGGALHSPRLHEQCSCELSSCNLKCVARSAGAGTGAGTGGGGGAGEGVGVGAGTGAVAVIGEGVSAGVGAGEGEGAEASE